MAQPTIHEEIPSVINPGTIPWEEPSAFKLDTPSEVDELNSYLTDVAGGEARIIDPIGVIADDLFEIQNPTKKGDALARAEFRDEVTAEGIKFGTWFYFPWSNELVRYADKQTHRDLRTMRNRELITVDEQAKLYEGTAAVFGLSVGSSAVRQLVLGGVAGTLITADMDVVTLSNTNRLVAEPRDLGGTKIDALAKYVSAVDPYIEQVHLREGADKDSIAEVIERHRPDFMVDAVDSFPVKALIRAFGKEAGIPVLMATDVGDTSLLDVEMYGDQETVPFNGRLTEEQHQALLDGKADEAQIQQMMFELVGLENVSERMMQSVEGLFTGELAGMPQLGSTATLGGVAVSRVAREIILGNPVNSGRRTINLDTLLLN